MSPTSLLSVARRPLHDVAAVDSLPPFYDRRDLTATIYSRPRSVVLLPDCDRLATPPTTTTVVQLAPSRLQFVHVIGHGLFGDVSA